MPHEVPDFARDAHSIFILRTALFLMMAIRHISKILHGDMMFFQTYVNLTHYEKTSGLNDKAVKSFYRQKSIMITKSLIRNNETPGSLFRIFAELRVFT